jgi:hypothetical protein
VYDNPTFEGLHPADLVPWCRIRYHIVVSNANKILAGMRRNARNWRIEDLEVVAGRFGVDVDGKGGTSHVTFRHPRAGRTTVPKHIPIKPWYVREFVEFISKLEDPDHD